MLSRLFHNIFSAHAKRSRSSLGVNDMISCGWAALEAGHLHAAKEMADKALA